MSKRENTSVKYNTELTESVIDDLYDGFSIGLNEYEAAENAGIPAEKLFEWMKAGDDELARSSREPDFQTGLPGLLARTVQRARLNFRVRNLQILKECAEGNEGKAVEDRLARVTAAAWLLENRGHPGLFLGL